MANAIDGSKYHINHKPVKPFSQTYQCRLCKSSVLIVDGYQKNVNLANLLVNALIAVVNLKKKDVVVAGLVLMPL